VHLGTVTAHMKQPAGNFSVVNDRVIFDNGITKRWRCPVCAWWREWEVVSCSACGTHRDTSTPNQRQRGSRRLGSGEGSGEVPFLPPPNSDSTK
jgi:hypothetical protein